jgi:hypothetical protein
MGPPGGPPASPLPFTKIVAAAPEVAAGGRNPTPEGATPAYCQVAFVYSSGANGPNATVPPSATNAGVPYPAYNVGQTQEIEILIALPLNSMDCGGNGGCDPNGVNGNWIGGVMTSGGAGMSAGTGVSGYGDGLNNEDAGYPIRYGYVSTISDCGESAAGLFNQGVSGSSSFAIISSGILAGKLAHGTIADWTYRGTHYSQQWGDVLAEAYYGKGKPKRHYYNGASGGGQQGMGQLQNFGNLYDGFLIGAPAYHWQQFRQSDSWGALVFRKLVQGGQALPTTAQNTALQAAVLALCGEGNTADGGTGVADGIIADTRLCQRSFTAQSLVCGVAGAPASPNCITTQQAAAYDRVYDGPRNHNGLRTYFPYDVDVSGAGGGGISATTVAGSTIQVDQYHHVDVNWDATDCLFVDADSATAGPISPNVCPAAGKDGTPITDENERTLGAQPGGVDNYTENQSLNMSLALSKGAKVIHLHGTADGAILSAQDIDYYTRVAVATYGGSNGPNYKKLQSWYRLFLMPSVGHVTGALGGGNGVSPVDPFLVLRNWVEHDIVPTSITGLCGGTSCIEPGRTRPLCPFPETAIYSGAGSTDDAANWTCGGNLQTKASACNDVRTPFGKENGTTLDYAGVGLTAAECRAYLPAANTYPGPY